MGDHRADIKIEMSFHGITKKCDMWINYSPNGEYYGVDDRIIEFIQEVYYLGMDKYNEQMVKLRFEENKKEIEDKEKAELERLTKKYNPL